jgi:uncharacterized repeat protein (TIGR03803 family)
MKSAQVVAFLTAVLVQAAGAGGADAAPFTLLHQFNGADGSFPSGIVVSGSSLYGTTDYGGASDDGTIFSLNTDGSGFAVLHDATPLEAGSGYPPIVDSSLVYVTTVAGTGDVSRINTNGSGYQPVFEFSNAGSSLWRPRGFTQSGSMLYGIAQEGGLGTGGIFRVGKNGTGYQALHSFSPAEGLAALPPTVEGSTLYGASQGGGAHGVGTVWRMQTDGTGFQVLHDFAADAGYPTIGPLLALNGVLYGATDYTVFKINTDGSGYESLHEFSPSVDIAMTPLALAGGKLIGASFTAIYQLSLDGTDFEHLHEFAPDLSEGVAIGPLAVVGRTVYGVTRFDSIDGHGTVFALVVPEPQAVVHLAVGALMLVQWRRRQRR